MRKFIILSVLICLSATVTWALPPITDGLVIHLDASSLGLSDGDPVSLWTDSSGSGNDATQENADDQPTFVSFSDDFNRPVVRFDGTSDWLALPTGEDAPFTLDAVTVLVNAKFNEIGANNQYIIACNSDVSGTTDRLRICLDTNAGGFLFRVGDSAWKGIYTTETNTDVHAFAITSTAEGYIDGALIGTSANGSSESPTSLNLGSFANGKKDWFNGDIAEVLIYNRVLTAEEIAEVGTYFTEGFLPNPSPANYETQAPVDTAVVAWDVPDVGFTPSKYVLTMRASDPNFIDTANNVVVDPVVDTNPDAIRVEAAMPITPLVNGQKYYWRVDVYNQDIVYPGSTLSFTVIPLDTAPVVDAGGSYITWLDNLPQTISGTVINNDDVDDIADADVLWSAISFPGDPTDSVARIILRGIDSEEAVTLKDEGYDPNMLHDWVGTDLSQTGNPLVLTFSDLPAGTYNWKSYHHDYADQTGTFNVYVNGVMVGEDIDISDADNMPTEFTTSFTSDGSDVDIIFEGNEEEFSVNNAAELKIFVLNGFELSDGTNELKVDFNKITPDDEEDPADDNDDDTISPTAPGFVAYDAINTDLSSFVAKTYTFGASEVTFKPAWGKNAAGWINYSLTKTSTDPLAPVAVFTTDTAGDYTLQLTATDGAGHSDSDTIVVRVAADTCAAAQLSSSWAGFNYFDIDNNCIVDLYDFAEFTSVWLENISAVNVEVY